MVKTACSKEFIKRKRSMWKSSSLGRWVRMVGPRIKMHNHLADITVVLLIFGSCVSGQEKRIFNRWLPNPNEEDTSRGDVRIIPGIKEKRFDKIILPVVSPANPLNPFVIYNFPESIWRASANLVADVPETPVQGEVIFQQWGVNNFVKLTLNVSGLPPGKHAVHIHSFGDISEGCKSTGIQLPGNFIGNIEAKPDGTLSTSFLSTFITLFGFNGIVGRSVVIHEKPIDINSSLNAEVFSTPLHILSEAASMQAEESNVGAAIACGVITITNNFMSANQQGVMQPSPPPIPSQPPNENQP